MDDIPASSPRTVAERLVTTVEHCRRLGLTVYAAAPGQLTLELPYGADIVGNPETGVIHGGALTTLMDSACGFAVPLGLGEIEVCPTLDLRIDYMTSARAGQSVFGRADIYRITRNVVFARGIAYQRPGEHVIAHCVATFMRLASPAQGEPQS